MSNTKTTYVVDVSERAPDTLRYTLRDSTGGNVLLSCLQDATATDIFLFTKARNVQGSAIIDLLDSRQEGDFEGVAYSNFMENECSVRNSLNSEVSLMR